MSRAKKRYGQHFLHDRGTIERIVNAIDPRPGDRIVEVGPGRGAISASLLSKAGRLDAIEIDPDVVPGLTARCEGLGQLDVHLADALEFDFRALRGDGPPLRLVGNLPYNVSTPLLFHFVSQIDAFSSMHFMLQKEVVTRMAAAPGGKEYGRLTVMLAPWVRVESLFDIGTGAFTPPPKVVSTFFALHPHASSAVRHRRPRRIRPRGVGRVLAAAQDAAERPFQPARQGRDRGGRCRPRRPRRDAGAGTICGARGPVAALGPLRALRRPPVKLSPRRAMPSGCQPQLVPRGAGPIISTIRTRTGPPETTNEQILEDPDLPGPDRGKRESRGARHGRSPPAPVPA